jgi:hypothetical protein
VGEIGGPLCGCGIDSVYQIDAHSFLFFLYGGQAPGDLLFSLKRGDQRFHLLFWRIHRDYRRGGSRAPFLAKTLVRGRIRAVRYGGGILEMDVVRGESRTLVLDFNSARMSVVDGNGARYDEAGIRLVPESVVLSFQMPDAARDPGTVNVNADAGLDRNRACSDEYLRRLNADLATRVLSAVKTERRKVQRLLEKLDGEQRDAADRDRWRVMGELMKYNLSRVPRGARSVTLSDGEGRPVEIALDPLLSPQENMNRLFDRYKKLKRRWEVIGEKVSYEERRLAALDDLAGQLGGGGLLSVTEEASGFLQRLDSDIFNPAFREKVRRLLSIQGAERRYGGTGVRDERGGAYLRFTARSGKTVLVGRTARENEELTLRHARGNDLWFHVAVGSGSHVILRYDRKGDFLDSDVVDAAMLALHFSSFRGERSGDVVYTHRKFVRKPKGSSPGKVLYHHNKTKHIVFDDDIMKRLLDSRPRGLNLRPRSPQNS